MKFRLGLILGIGLGAAILGVGVLLASAASVGVSSQSMAVRNAAVIVPLSAPTLSQVASAGGNGGLTSVTTSATLSSGTSNATGTLSFKLWNDATCTVQFGATSSVPVSGANRVSYNSGPLVPMLAGVYRWTVDYSGDANNLSVIGSCGVTGSTVAITVGPAAKLAFTQQPGGGAATLAWTSQPTVTVQDAGGNTIVGSTASITLVIGTNPNSGVLTCATNPNSAVGGVATFTGCRIEKAASGYTLVASSGVLTSATSVSFTISVGSPTTVAFAQQPGGADANVALSVQPIVTVQDAGGNTVTSSSASIALAIETNPASGVLNCATNPLVAASGSATFAGCTISKTGVGYTVVASSSGLTSATSTAFTITAAPLNYSSVGAPSSATSNGTVTVSYPAGTADNDLLVLIEINSTSGNTTTPSGWTLQANQSANSPAKFGIKVWTRLSAGESSVELAFKAGAAGSTAWVARYTRSSGYPPNPTTATARVRSGVSGASATFTPTPDLTTNAANATVMSIAAVRSLNTLSLATAQSFGFRFTQTNTPTGGQGVAIAIADSVQVTTPMTPLSPTWTQSGTAAQWTWATIAWH
jgi:hypothetical protein